MSFLKNLEKNVKEWHVLIIVGLAILAYVMYDYSCKKNMLLSNYQGTNGQRLTPASLDANAGAGAGAGANAGAVVGFSADDDNLDGPAAVNSGSAISVTPPVAATMNKEIMNPADLLPKDTNNAWSAGLAPNNELKNVNLLTAGHHIGINTVGSSLRNANLQLRSEPPNPRNPNLSPWNNSTIEPDTTRKPLC